MCGKKPECSVQCSPKHRGPRGPPGLGQGGAPPQQHLLPGSPCSRGPPVPACPGPQSCPVLLSAPCLLLSLWSRPLPQPGGSRLLGGHHLLLSVGPPPPSMQASGAPCPPRALVPAGPGGLSRGACPRAGTEPISPGGLCLSPAWAPHRPWIPPQALASFFASCWPGGEGSRGAGNPRLTAHFGVTPAVPLSAWGGKWKGLCENRALGGRWPHIRSKVGASGTWGAQAVPPWCRPHGDSCSPARVQCGEETWGWSTPVAFEAGSSVWTRVVVYYYKNKLIF